LLQGGFDLRNSAPMNAEVVLCQMLDQLGDLLPDSLDDQEKRLQIRRVLRASLDEHRTDASYMFNLFEIVPPLRFRRHRAGSSVVLVWEAAFQKVSLSPEPLSACATTLEDFEKLKTPADCLEFAGRWGKLGPKHDKCYFWLTQDADDSVRHHVRDQLGRNGVVVRVRRETQTEEGLFTETLTCEPNENISLTGEPVDAWLWHAARLRTWRRLLKLVSKVTTTKRRFERIRMLLSKSTDSWSEGEATVVHDLAQERRLASEEDLVATDQVKPWTYALHQEGGEFGFSGAEFDEMRGIMDPRSRRIDAKAVQRLIELALRRTLHGHITIAPKIGRVSDELVECDSLLAWLYLEFAGQHTDELGLTRLVYVRCIVCGEETPESPHVRGRKSVCSPRCQKRLERLGEEEARRRFGPLSLER
jgi:hypothetical protein